MENGFNSEEEKKVFFCGFDNKFQNLFGLKDKKTSQPIFWRHDIQHNDIQLNDTHRNDIQHNDK